MKRKQAFAAFGVMTFAALASVGRTAGSDTLPAVSGHAWLPDQQVCFSSAFATVTNSSTAPQCRNNTGQGTGRKKFLIGLPSRWNGTTRFSATANQATVSVGKPKCTATIHVADNSPVFGTPWKDVSPLGTVLGDVAVFSGDTQIMECDLMNKVDDPTATGLSQVGWSLL